MKHTRNTNCHGLHLEASIGQCLVKASLLERARQQVPAWHRDQLGSENLKCCRKRASAYAEMKDQGSGTRRELTKAHQGGNQFPSVFDLFLLNMAPTTSLVGARILQ